MLIMPFFTKKQKQNQQHQQAVEIEIEDPNHNNKMDEDTLKKLHLYQKRTYANQEQSRRRSIQRHAPNTSRNGHSPFLQRSRTVSAPTYHLYVARDNMNEPNRHRVNSADNASRSSGRIPENVENPSASDCSNDSICEKVGSIKLSKLPVTKSFSSDGAELSRTEDCSSPSSVKKKNILTSCVHAYTDDKKS